MASWCLVKPAALVLAWDVGCRVKMPAYELAGNDPRNSSRPDECCTVCEEGNREALKQRMEKEQAERRRAVGESDCPGRYYKDLHNQSVKYSRGLDSGVAHTASEIYGCA